MKIALIVPTYCAGKLWSEFWQALEHQTRYPDVIQIIDSGSTDNTVAIAQAHRHVSCTIIDKTDFNHGGTRNLAVSMVEDVDILIFLTQDAILNDATALENILEIFEDKDVAAVCGRQLPHHDANPIARHARLFNYPSVSSVKTKNDIPSLGIKTVFMSNSFAAYRACVYKEMGGFPLHTILAEDMYMAARMIQAGYKVAYCAEAAVRHSHNYTPAEEFKRYFDTGVFHETTSWIQQDFGGAGGEGVRFVKSEIIYLLKHAPLWLIRAGITTVAKLSGYKLGLRWRSLSLKQCKKLSMYKSYWNRADLINNQK